MPECNGCTIERLRQLLEYDPKTGMFRWRNPNPWQAKGWFRGNHSTRQYRRLYIDSKHYMAHIVAWALKKGQWPDHEIDHRDRDQNNNKWGNLRKADRYLQNQNRGKHKSNKTGVKGVSVFGKRFRVGITANGHVFRLGVYDTLWEAALVRKRAERKYHAPL